MQSNWHQAVSLRTGGLQAPDNGAVSEDGLAGFTVVTLSPQAKIIRYFVCMNINANAFFLQNNYFIVYFFKIAYAHRKKKMSNIEKESVKKKARKKSLILPLETDINQTFQVCACEYMCICVCVKSWSISNSFITSYIDENKEIHST